jgi:hypothetical protein
MDSKKTQTTRTNSLRKRKTRSRVRRSPKRDDDIVPYLISLNKSFTMNNKDFIAWFAE